MIASLARDLRAALADAERYRYLRDALGDGYLREQNWQVKWWSGKQYLWCNSSLLDERIDAAQESSNSRWRLGTESWRGNE